MNPSACAVPYQHIPGVVLTSANSLSPRHHPCTVLGMAQAEDFPTGIWPHSYNFDGGNGWKGNVWGEWMQARPWHSLKAGEWTLCCFSCIVGAVFQLFPISSPQMSANSPLRSSVPSVPFLCTKHRIPALDLVCLTPAAGLDAFISTLQNIDSGNHMSQSNFYASETAFIFCFSCLY